MSEIQGKVWKYGDNVNTDVIFPGKYTYTVSEPSEMPKYALEDLDPGICQRCSARRCDRGRHKLGLRILPGTGSGLSQ